MYGKPSTRSTVLYPDSKILTYLKNYNLPLLSSLLAVDFAFIILHTLKSLDYLSNPNFSVTKNFGYGESFMYLNELFIIGCFLWLGFKFLRPVFFSWAAIFVYVLLDDSLEVHETIGYYFGGWLKDHTNIIPVVAKESAEISSFALFGIILFTPLLLAYTKTKNKHLKIATQDLLILLGGLLFFGIGIDFLNIFFETGHFLNGFLGLLEDAGEMVMMSLIAWYSWTFISHSDYVQKKESAEQTQQFNKKSAITLRNPLGPSPVWKSPQPTGTSSDNDRKQATG